MKNILKYNWKIRSRFTSPTCSAVLLQKVLDSALAAYDCLGNTFVYVTERVKWLLEA